MKFSLTPNTNVLQVIQTLISKSTPTYSYPLFCKEYLSPQGHNQQNVKQPVCRFLNQSFRIDLRIFLDFSLKTVYSTMAGENFKLMVLKLLHFRFARQKIEFKKLNHLFFRTLLSACFLFYLYSLNQNSLKKLPPLHYNSLF